MSNGDHTRARAQCKALFETKWCCLLNEGHSGPHRHIEDQKEVSITWGGDVSAEPNKSEWFEPFEPSTSINHPPHYGGAENVYEAIKVIEAWSLGFCLGNCVKYICRAGKKPVRAEEHTAARSTPIDKVAFVTDLKKARWYLDREIQNAEQSAQSRK